MRTPAIVKKAFTLLPTVAGSVLIFAAVAQTALAGLAVPEVGSSALWTLIEGMLPIPGGAVHPVPEIDPDSTANAVALVFGLMLLIVGLSGRRRAQAVSQ